MTRLERQFIVRGLRSDVFISKVWLETVPSIGDVIEVNRIRYIVRDMSIGRRLIDELYVEEAK